MPSLGRRRETDSRAGRLESEMRMQELEAIKPVDGRPRKRIYMCSKCHRCYEERSRHCPRCDTRSMGELRPIGKNEEERKRLHDASMRRLMDKHR